MNVYDAFWYFKEKDLEIEDIIVVKVNPATDSVDDDERLNTKIRVWIEINKTEFDWNHKTKVTTHYWQFDSGGNTFEEALITAAKKARGYFAEDSDYPEWEEDEEDG